MGTSSWVTRLALDAISTFDGTLGSPRARPRLARPAGTDESCAPFFPFRLQALLPLHSSFTPSSQTNLYSTSSQPNTRTNSSSPKLPASPRNQKMSPSTSCTPA